MRKGTFLELIRRLRGGVAMFVFARRILQTWVKNYLTRRLNESRNLEASLGEVELYFLQGQAVVRQIRLTKMSEGRRVVEAHSREISIHIQWRKLLHGTLVGHAILLEPHVEIVADRESDPDGKSLSDVLLAICRESQRLMPFHLRSLEAIDGRIEYVSKFTSPPFKLTLDSVSLSATNLTNIAAPAFVTNAHVLLEGRTAGNGQFWVRLTLPSSADALTFDLEAGLNRVNLVELNDVLRAYAKFDLKRGICSIYSEFKVEGGRYEGYIQPRFQDLDIFAWQKEHGKSFLQICRQAAIAIVARILKNQGRDELALNIPISGAFDEPDVDTWSAVGSLLRNAFDLSLLPHSPQNGSRRETKWWSHLNPWKGNSRHVDSRI